MVREGSVLPHAAVAPHTGAMDWSAIELRVYPGEATRGARQPATGLFSLPDGDLVALEVPAATRALSKDPLSGRVKWRVVAVQPQRGGAR